MVSVTTNTTARVTPSLTEGEEIRRLLTYLLPYTGLLAAGVLLMAVMGAADGIVAFALKPAFDVVLNPQTTVQKLILFQVPWSSHVVYMNSFVPEHL